MSGAGHLLGCREMNDRRVLLCLWRQYAGKKIASTKETRFSLRTERQLNGTFTTWNLINVKTWVKISFRNGSCPWGLLSDVVVLQSHFPSLLKCLAAWENEKQSHVKLFRGLSFLFSFSWCNKDFGKVPLRLLKLFLLLLVFFYFILCLYLSLALTSFSHCRG